MWRKYLGDNAVIFGIDVDARCGQFDDPQLNIRIGSQADPTFLRSVVEEMGGVDIVLDDGSHVASHQRVTFDTVFPLLSYGGIYAAEDLHTSYWTNFGGGYRRKGTFLEVVKAMIDDMHTWHHDHGPRVIPAESGVDHLSIYDSLVFIHKAARARPMDVEVGTPSF